MNFAFLTHSIGALAYRYEERWWYLGFNGGSSKKITGWGASPHAPPPPTMGNPGSDSSGFLLWDLQIIITFLFHLPLAFRGGSSTDAISKMKCFLIIVNFQSLTIITKCPILDVAADLDLPLALPGSFDVKARRISTVYLKNSTAVLTWCFHIK